MNHPIKGIIIVAAITSMLVLGATTIPITQNSFASKKHDFKGAERDRNTNVNRNSATSSSSSDATADNTNDINNTATSAQSQSQSACTVALTCPEGSTTVTVTPPTPPTPPTSSTCHPPVIGGITATPTDDTCTATILASAGEGALINFGNTCRGIPGSTLTVNEDSSETCTFPSTPPA
jgi:hypothetical protein